MDPTESNNPILLSSFNLTRQTLGMALSQSGRTHQKILIVDDTCHHAPVFLDPTLTKIDLLRSPQNSVANPRLAMAAVMAIALPVHYPRTHGSIIPLDNSPELIAANEKLNAAVGPAAVERIARAEAKRAHKAAKRARESLRNR